MNTSTCGFAHYKQSLQTCGAIKSGLYTAAHIVRRRRHRDEFCHRIYSHVSTRRRNGWKSFFKVLNASCVEIHVVIHTCWCFGHASTNRSSHNIARSKVFLRVHTCHYASACCIEKNCSFSAHCFTDECLLPSGFAAYPQHGGVKLNEL